MRSRSTLAFVIFTTTLAGSVHEARAEFPLDRELLLDAAPKRPSKRMPSLTITAGGEAVIDLWCRSVKARADIGDGTLTLTPDTLPEALPDMVGPGQCSDERQRADDELLTALSSVTGWRAEEGGIVLTGSTLPMRFQPASN